MPNLESSSIVMATVVCDHGTPFHVSFLIESLEPTEEEVKKYIEENVANEIDVAEVIAYTWDSAFGFVHMSFSFDCDDSDEEEEEETGN